MDANIVGTQVSSAIIAVWLMQKLKEAHWFPLLKQMGQNPWIKRGVSMVTALGILTGISHIWNPGTVPGGHQLVINIPPVMVILEGLWHWSNQYIYQESAYQLFYNRVSTTTDAAGAIPARVNAAGEMVVPQPAPK